MSTLLFQIKTIYYRLIFIFFCGILFSTSCKEDVDGALPSPGRMIREFKLKEGQVGTEKIFSSGQRHEILLTVLSSVDFTKITPAIVLSDGATISPASGQPIDVSSTLSYTYTVTAASGLQREWIVNFKIASTNVNIGNYGAYIITNQKNDKALEVAGDIKFNDKYWANALIVSGNAKSDKWQKWHLILANDESGLKYYKIRNLFSGMYLTVPDSTKIQGLQLQQERPFEGKDEDRQLWRLNTSAGDNVFQVFSKSTGLALANDAATGKVVLHTGAEGNEQLWKFLGIEMESYRDIVVQNFFRRNESWMGAVAFDQGNSIPLTWGPNAGKVLWITEDAWHGQQLKYPDALDCNSFFKYNNSILIQPSKDNWDPRETVNMTNPETKHPDRIYQIMDVQDGMDWTWPGVGIEMGDKVYVYAGEGKGLNALQSALYILHQNAGTAWKVERTTPKNVGGADGMIKDDDGYVYCYSNEGFNFGYESYVHVRRFLQEDPQKDWEFWNGTEWTTDPVSGPYAAVAISRATTSVAKIKDKYVMMSMDQGFWCTDERGIYLSTADRPTGPWSEKILVYSIEEYLKGDKARFYTPIIHPHAINEQNELLLTYCLNFEACGQTPCEVGKDGQNILHAYYYRDKAVRVPLSVIGM